MHETMKRMVASFVKQRTQRRRAYAAFTALAILVSISTTYILVRPASTLEGKLVCGMEEHVHTDACYERVLVCGMEEGEPEITEGSAPAEEVPPVEPAPPVEAQPDTSSDAAEGAPAEEVPGDAAAVTLAEEPAAAPAPEVKRHVHTDACYEMRLVCGKEEHTHTDACYEKKADAPATPEEQLRDQGDLMVVLPEGAEVPAGYDAEYNFVDSENRFGVTVYAPAGAVPEGAELLAELLKEDSKEYKAAEKALKDSGMEKAPEEGNDVPAAAQPAEPAGQPKGLAALLSAPADKADAPAKPASLVETDNTPAEAPAEAAGGYDGFLAMDIRFMLNGEEVEPTEPVFVCINAMGLLPENAIPESVSVQHHAEAKDEGPSLMSLFAGKDVTVETVADNTQDTTGIIEISENTEVPAQDMAAAFDVDSFSTFTLTWKEDSIFGGESTKATLKIECIDAQGNKLATPPVPLGKDIKTATDVTAIAPVQIENRTFTKAVVAATPEAATTSTEKVQKIRCAYEFTGLFSGEYRWQYQKPGSETWNQLGSKHIYFVYGEAPVDPEIPPVIGSGTISTEKTATLQPGQDIGGLYDLNLAISGDRGSVTQKAPVDILFIVDTSGSMEGTRMSSVKTEIENLTKTVSANKGVDARYAGSSFAGVSQAKQKSWCSADEIVSWTNGLKADGGTNYQKGIYEGKKLLEKHRAGAATYVIFLSDGLPTYRGTSSNSGSGSNDSGSKNINAAVEEIKGMTCDNFYAIGFGSEFNDTGKTPYKNMVKLKDNVQATNKAVYNASDSAALDQVFQDITGSITFFGCKDVHIHDTLSPNVTAVAGTDGQYMMTVKVTRDDTELVNKTVASGTKVSFKDANKKTITVTPKFDSKTGKITMDFPAGYELEKGYKYNVGMVIKPSAEAEADFAANGKFPDISDPGTGTHENGRGYFSNVNNEAYVQFKNTDGSQGENAIFPKPVVQVYYSNETASATLHTEKSATLQPGQEPGGIYDLRLAISGERGSISSTPKVDVLFIIDKSGSMDYQVGNEEDGDSENPSRYTKVKAAIKTLTDTLSQNNEVDVQYAAAVFSRSQDSKTQSWCDSKTLNDYVSSVKVTGGTNYQQGIHDGKNLLKTARGDATKIVIFLSDGEPTYRGVNVHNKTDSSTNGNGQNDKGGENIAAAKTEISSMKCDEFYALGIGPDFAAGKQGMKNMNTLANAVQATKTGVYSATNTADLEKAFQDITGNITFFACKNVVVTDPLSEYAEVADASNVPLTVAVTNKAGESKVQGNATVTSGQQVTFLNSKGTQVKVTPSYDPASKTIKLVFPADYELEQGYEYSVTTPIKPTQKAVDDFAATDVFPHTPDANTGTHADRGEDGFFSNINDSAKVTFTANKKDGEAFFPKPVIQVVPAPKVGDIIIGKDVMVNGAPGQNGQLFTFDLVTDAAVNGVFDLTYDPANTDLDQTITFNNGKATIQIPAGTKVTVAGLPIGTKVSVTETNYDGYAPSWTTDGTTVNNGDTADVTVAEAPVAVQFTNTTGAALPSTGGIGTHLYTLFGMMTMLGAGALLLIQRRRREVPDAE